ncbi:MAG: helix-turn-helix domain-containing protein [Pirellula sp.]|jgi:hypothetical protein|nr:helix-turn-helix transcriptional regulator [Pirellula sp.]
MSLKRVCEAIEFDGLSVNRVAALAEIPQSSLQRFCSGTQGLQMDGLQRVCDVLGLELVRRFDEDDLEEYLKEGWEVALENAKEEYESEKSEEWGEYAKEEWKKLSSTLWEAYCDENEIDSGDNDEFINWESDAYTEWETEEYGSWSMVYDQEYYQAWQSESNDEWRSEELERLRNCDWIVLP